MRIVLNTIHEQAKIINEKMSGMGSPCVKSTVLNVGNDTCMGQDKPSHFSNMGMWEE